MEHTKKIEEFGAYMRGYHRFLSGMKQWEDSQNWCHSSEEYIVPDIQLVTACTLIEVLGRLFPLKRSIYEGEARRGRNPERCFIEGSRRIFTNTLVKHSSGPEWGLVSIPELWWALRNPDAYKDKEFRNCLKAIGTRKMHTVFAELGYKEMYNTPNGESFLRAEDVDTEPENIPQSVLGIIKDKKLDGILEKFTIAGILYRDLRCGIIHEGIRNLRCGTVYKSVCDVPHYGFLNTTKKSLWYPEKAPFLSIPNAYLLKSLLSCIESAITHCADEDIDPWDKLGWN